MFSGKNLLDNRVELGVYCIQIRRTLDASLDEILKILIEKLVSLSPFQKNGQAQCI